jgi:hypothetical protein
MVTFKTAYLAAVTNTKVRDPAKAQAKVGDLVKAFN